MTILTVAVIAVGCLCLVDLLLTFGVVRRLRQHTELLGARGGEQEVLSLGLGVTPGSFEAVTTADTAVAGPVGVRLAAFFSPSCPVCPRRVPAFADYVRTSQLASDAVLAVVLAGDGEWVPYLDQLTEVASVCVQPADGELATAFGVLGYPAFCLLDADGAIQAVSFDPAELPELAIA